VFDDPIWPGWEPAASLPHRLRAAEKKASCVTDITEQMTELSDDATEGNSGRPAMKIFFAGLALAITLAFSSEAFALPSCPNSTSQHGHYGCTVFEE
jgi:hypothetical protein